MLFGAFRGPRLLVYVPSKVVLAKNQRNAAQKEETERPRLKRGPLGHWNGQVLAGLLASWLDGGSLLTRLALVVDLVFGFRQFGSDGGCELRGVDLVPRRRASEVRAKLYSQGSNITPRGSDLDRAPAHKPAADQITAAE